MGDLSYSRRDDGICVSVPNDSHNLSWAVLDYESGRVVRECKPYWIMPGLTDAQLEEAREAIKHLHLAPYEDAYIRFNELPECGYSTNHATGERELGISCYDATWDMVDGCHRRFGGGLDGAAMAYLTGGSSIYLVTGCEVARGSDGELVIADVEIVAELEFDMEKKGYTIVNAQGKRPRRVPVMPLLRCDGMIPVSSRIISTGEQGESSQRY